MSSESLAQTFHDVRNALNVIMGNVQLLQESKPFTVQQQEYASRIVNAVREVSATLGNYSIDVSEGRDELKVTISVAEKAKPTL
jgi:signal transduction histidine kinase